MSFIFIDVGTCHNSGSSVLARTVGASSKMLLIPSSRLDSWEEYGQEVEMLECWHDTEEGVGLSGRWEC